MKIGLVSPYDLSVPGGVQAQVLGLARYLDSHGVEPMVIGPGLPSGVDGVDLGDSVTIPGNGSKVPISVDPRCRGLLREASVGLDLLHVHEPLMPLVSLFATRAGPPVVATFHAAPGPVGRVAYRLTGPVMRWLLGKTVAVTAVSPTAAAVLPVSMGIRIIPNGLDLATMRSDVQRDPGRVAFLGRDEPRKGLDVLLEAWPRVLEAVPGATLTVMGADRGDLGVKWMGRVDHPTKVEVLGSTAVFVAPHLGGESFGIVLLEAMASGAAVVSSNLDAFVDVADGAARFFPVGDSAALARALVEVLTDPAERGRLASVGHEIAARYDWEVVGASYRSLYAEFAS
ncbi:MAG TPA: glycosyltransferase family 4 protein [Acidimicrobiia bacterium]|nr:glycosyltransferase family 4 protein [Acidimicrobiia bacterium]